ncbi:twin-arginine translocation pathway signal [Williamsia sp.]|uniref:twin-arginine translocation pathway signal n=1 Tax=Williamsia sp. TaxID=1872085 RepID=UPI002F921482
MSESTPAVTLTKKQGSGDATEVDAPAQESMPASARGRLFGTVAAASLVAASLVTVAATYYFLYAPDNHTDSGAKESAMTAANSGTVALLSYSPDTLTDDLAAAKTHLSGEFLAYYTEFTEKVVAPAAQENAVDTQAEVVRSAVSDISESSATVLVFINQTTTSTDKPDPALTASSVRVTLTKADDTWKISAFDPV